MKSALDLDITAGGSFAHTSATERREVLDSLLENSFFPTGHSEPCREESILSHERISTLESDLSFFISPYSFVEPSPKPQISEKEPIQPPEFFPRFEDDSSGNIRNTSNHLRHEEAYRIVVSS